MEAATHMQPQPEDDPLGSLEDRIRRAVTMVSTLKAERDAAVDELDSAKRLAAAAQSEAQKLRSELDGLRSERKQVRVRIEKLRERTARADGPVERGLAVQGFRPPRRPKLGIRSGT